MPLECLRPTIARVQELLRMRHQYPIASPVTANLQHQGSALVRTHRCHIHRCRTHRGPALRGHTLRVHTSRGLASLPLV